MLRKDRELINIEDMIEVLKRCDTLRIAFKGDKYPYVVPVSFGIREENGTVFLYIHGAKVGFKVEQIEKNPCVCAEGDILFKVEETAYGITARYESVIAYGIIEKVEGDEIADGLRAICEHYGYSDFCVETCKSLSMTAVYKIRIEKMTGKRNIPK